MALTADVDLTLRRTKSAQGKGNLEHPFSSSKITKSLYLLANAKLQGLTNARETSLLNMSN